MPICPFSSCLQFAIWELSSSTFIKARPWGFSVVQLTSSVSQLLSFHLLSALLSHPSCRYLTTICHHKKLTCWPDGCSCSRLYISLKLNIVSQPSCDQSATPLSEHWLMRDLSLFRPSVPILARVRVRVMVDLAIVLTKYCVQKITLKATHHPQFCHSTVPEGEGEMSSMLDI